MQANEETDNIDDVRSTLVSHNITVLGRRTSVRLEPEMWNALREISKREKCRISDICSLIYLRKNKKTSLTAAIRVFMMLYYRSAATETGHQKAGHGSFQSMIERARVSMELFPRYNHYSHDNYEEKELRIPISRRTMDNDRTALPQHAE